MPYPVINLDYINLIGKYDASYNLSYFRRIPYAAPPTGENRFRRPQPPAQEIDPYETDQPFNVCPQDATNGSEDCLYLGLYSRPWTPDDKARPVFVAFHGGGFFRGGGPFTIPPSGYPILNVSNTNDFILVYPNYRLNAFGFLPGKLVRASGGMADLNVGLLDQQFVLQWVQKYISKFGGDPERVTIWGQSAGGGSVIAQVIANGGSTSPKLFSRAIASSPFWPKTYQYDDPEADDIFLQMVMRTGCDLYTDSLACLKSVDPQKIRDASQAIVGSHTYTTSTYTWAPVIDGVFIKESLTDTVLKGQINVDTVLTIYNSHEGETFMPPGFNSNVTGSFNSTSAGFDDWLRGFLPKLNSSHIVSVNRLYPPAGQTETMSYNTTELRAGLIYRDVVLACPAYWTSKAASKGYLAEYTIAPAKHASDYLYWHLINPDLQDHLLTYKGFTGAFASIIQTGDPNQNKLTPEDQPGLPLVSEGKEFVIDQDAFENLLIVKLREKCEFWAGIGMVINV
ncbi:acetylcholinesterase precursor [Patellaria atrata CBS 101060]|uniref:Carboxylic ester hydrolase n=1 Tax=Patellaria atrata CBS 101060 TaxID=1346257 RepID=A0A9P4VRK9_9PEZI|nr:acetylcholinesterase precursor [Patellaria atrata CBS 101060]